MPQRLPEDQRKHIERLLPVSLFDNAAIAAEVQCSERTIRRRAAHQSNNTKLTAELLILPLVRRCQTDGIDRSYIYYQRCLLSMWLTASDTSSFLSKFSVTRTNCMACTRFSVETRSLTSSRVSYACYLSIWKGGSSGNDYVLGGLPG